MEFAKRVFSKMVRVKTVSEDLHETSLRRCLNTFDLTLLGIGHMIGAGIYVLSGTVVREMAGPSTILSFLFAGFAALLSALCYAEFGARIPKAGSAYSYTYYTIGELWGFLIGWNLVLEHMVGLASVARAWSGALDAAFDGAIRNGTIEALGVLAHDSVWISPYPDLVATCVIILSCVIIGIGAKTSINFNTIFTILNAIVLLFIIIAAFVFADIDNWSNDRGGFFPYGFGGTLSGAATCFFSFIGFEGIGVAGEEAKNPEKSIPIATVLALAIVTAIYLLVTSGLTLMIPYYDTVTSAAFPFAFAEVGAGWAKYIVACGTLFGISTSLMGGAFSLPRSVYAMADDGLLFKFLAYVHPKTQTPIVAIMVFGTLSGLLALLFEISTLVEFMSIGTLFGYTIVAASIIILRYQPVSKCQFKLKPEEEMEETQAVATESTPLSKSDPCSPDKSEKQNILPKSKSHDDIGRLRQNLRQIPVLRRFEPGDGVKSAVVFMGVFMLGLGGVAVRGSHYLLDGTWWAVLLTIVFSILIVVFYLVIVAHEQNNAFLTFQIPFIPFLPSLSMLINICLMMALATLTWLRLLIWITLGLLVYFVYGIHYSRENSAQRGYGPMVEYTGDAALPENRMTSLSEEVKEQQPERKDEGLQSVVPP